MRPYRPKNTYTDRSHRLVRKRRRSSSRGSMGSSFSFGVLWEKLPARFRNMLRIPRKYRRQYLIMYGVVGIVGVLLFVFLSSLILFAWYGRDLPSPDKLSASTGNSTIFYDREGTVIYEMFKDKNRIPVKIDEVSQYMQDATISIEDKNFYKHTGYSQLGMIRALLNILLGRGLQGGSTITQQLIKNVLLESERTMSRKVKELILATEVERRYSKDEILQMYLNEVPYGGSYWGVFSASQAYFDKKPKDLSLVESAILAGLPQNPTEYSPFIGGKDAWKFRAQDVLRRMREDKKITRDEEKKALENLEKVKFSEPNLAIDAPHFVFFVQKHIEEEFGKKIIEKGVKVKTTLYMPIQKKAQEIVKEEVMKLGDYNVGNGAAVVLDSETSEILAMVGSYDFNNKEYGKWNVATSNRQPGSTLKPIVYASAFQKGYTPATVIMDVPTEFHGNWANNYEPVNYDGVFRGPVQVRFALGNSYNIPAVKMLAMVGVKDFLTLADDMGIHSLEPTEERMQNLGLSVALGGGDVRLIDLANAYTVFARGGTAHELQFVDEIVDFDGKKIYERKEKENKNERVLSEQVSYLISHILSDNNARVDTFGYSSGLVIPGKTVAVKTGTTDDKKDNWAVGYTTTVTVAAWVGNNDNTPMNRQIASGVTGATPIWNRVMEYSLRFYEHGIMLMPEDITAMEIDAWLGGLPREGEPTRIEYFIDGTEPNDISSYYRKVKISKENGKLANEVEIRAGNYEEKDLVVFAETDPISLDGRNRWQEAIDVWVSEQEDGRFLGSIEKSDARVDDVVVSIKEPSDRQRIDDNRVTVRAKIASIEPVRNVTIYANGNEIRNLEGDRDEINESIELGDGTYDLTVRAWNTKDKSGDSTIKIGVKRNWDEEGGNDDNDDQQQEEQPTDVPDPTATPEPTQVSEATAKPEPTAAE